MNKDFKLPGNSYPEVAKIVQAYGHLNSPASLDEVSKACGVNATQISRNNGFLASVGIIDGGSKKKITVIGKKLSDAMSYDLDREVSSIWREILLENEFITKMITALKIRKGMDSQSFQSHIAYSSGQKNNGTVRAGANCIIDILLVANMIIEEDDKLIVINDQNHSEVFDVSNHSIDTEEVNSKKNIDNRNITHPTLSKVMNFETGGVNISIDVKINAGVDELDGLGLKLRKMIDELKADNTSE